MLRASIESSGREVDLSGVAEGSSAKDSPVSGAGVLTDFVDAVIASLTRAEGSEPELEAVRDRVRTTLGEAALVDAAAIIGNFERMVRIADGTGIPLDTPVNVATESIRSDLGIDRFEAAARTNSVKPWQRVLGRTLDPLLRSVLRRRARRSDSGGA